VVPNPNSPRPAWLRPRGPQTGPVLNEPGWRCLACEFCSSALRRDCLTADAPAPLGAKRVSPPRRRCRARGSGRRGGYPIQTVPSPSGAAHFSDQTADSVNRVKTQGINFRKIYILLYKVRILLMDMRTTETASRRNHQPLPANLEVSALLLRFMLGCEEFQARPSDHRITGSPDHPILLTLPPRPRSCALKLPASNPLASGVSSLESRRLAERSHAASDPLAVKPFEIKASSGLADRTPFFAKKSKVATSRAAIDAISRSGHCHHENLDCSQNGTTDSEFAVTWVTL
jgi:hypothetical protein